MPLPSRSWFCSLSSVRNFTSPPLDAVRRARIAGLEPARRDRLAGVDERVGLDVVDVEHVVERVAVAVRGRRRPAPPRAMRNASS